jgi:hypothetical protein
MSSGNVVKHLSYLKGRDIQAKFNIHHYFCENLISCTGRNLVSLPKKKKNSDRHIFCWTKVTYISDRHIFCGQSPQKLVTGTSFVRQISDTLVTDTLFVDKVQIH